MPPLGIMVGVLLQDAFAVDVEAVQPRDTVHDHLDLVGRGFAVALTVQQERDSLHAPTRGGLSEGLADEVRHVGHGFQCGRLARRIRSEDAGHRKDTCVSVAGGLYASCYVFVRQSCGLQREVHPVSVGPDIARAECDQRIRFFNPIVAHARRPPESSGRPHGSEYSPHFLQKTCAIGAQERQSRSLEVLLHARGLCGDAIRHTGPDNPGWAAEGKM